MAILVVDDSNDGRLSLRALLASAGYREVATVGSADEAFAFLGLGAEAPRRDVDLILMDAVMPGLDGVEACRRLKESETFRDVPVIMITGRPDAKDIETAFSVGAADYLTKPVRPVELLARVRAALSLRQEMLCRQKREEELLDVTRQLEEANERLQRLSSLDAVTEIPNRRSFDASLERTWSFARRKAVSVAAVMADIDAFKAFNDAYGHQAGDACLRAVASALAGSMHRRSDLVARYGGEEFAAVLLDTDEAGAITVAEAMRRAVADLAIPHTESGVRPVVTISVGVAAVVPSARLAPADLVAAADAALYAAKRAGRDQVRAAGPVVPSPTAAGAADGAEKPAPGTPIPWARKEPRSGSTAAANAAPVEAPLPSPR